LKHGIRRLANCLRLANDHAELILTLDVGPRVISYQVTGGKNVFKTTPEELGKSHEPHFVPRGGHRIWIAPENERTYAPDNVPVAHELLPDGVHMTNAAKGALAHPEGIDRPARPIPPP
jgi:hypothetical protein